MHLRTDLCLVTVVVATVMGCDDPYAEVSDFDTSASPAETTAKVDEPQRAASLEYEDPEDSAILNDRSNLRPSDVSPLEHRRSLSLRFRDELRQQMDGVQLSGRPVPAVQFPTDEEVASLSMRWFVTGTGFIVQNPTERPFTVSAYFSATADPACGVTVPLRAVPAGGSAMLSPEDSGECAIDRADVTVTDQYGFLVNQVAVEREEREP
jgi:hypothetical protein